MSNPFATHGIKHLSASSLNGYARDPAMWVMQRLLKVWARVGAAAHRGTAIEAGIAAGLVDNATLAECQAIALAKFDELVKPYHKDRDKEREAVAPSVAIGLAELQQYGKPDLVQHKVQLEMDGVPVPFIGYIDFGWTNWGILADLKTTSRIPSEIKDEHARQLAGYLHGTNYEGRIAYVSAKKIEVYRLEDPHAHFAAMRQIALRLGNLLAISSDPVELAKLVVPNYENFTWNDPMLRAKGREIFGF